MPKYTIIFNCSTNTVGGAVQNAVNFIREIYNHYQNNYSWYFIISKPVAEQLSDIIINLNYYVSEKTPAHSYYQRKTIEGIINKIKPSLVYTSAGPAYLNISSLHLMGCSNPYILGVDKNIRNILFTNPISRLKRDILTFYQRKHIKKASMYIAQTEYSKEQLQSITQNKNIYLIYNSISEDFFNYYYDSKLNADNFAPLPSNNRRIKILIPSSYYKHKNIEIIPSIIKRIKYKYNIDVNVTLTIKNCDFERYIKDIAQKNNVTDNITNIGPYNHAAALSLYLDHDIILQPSMVEVFSTSYIETIAVNKPLVAPNIEFVKSIVSDYPLYYAYSNIDECIDNIYLAYSNLLSFHDKHSQNDYINKYGSQSERTGNIINLIDTILVEKGHI
ncbi:TPA: glycosyltransferase [Morganella morganii]